MDKLINNGLQLYKAAKKELFKLKYAYQITRLAHYSGNYPDAVKFYDDYIAPNKTKSVLHPLSLSLKAGALYHMGQKKEAAYIFSRLFSNADVKKISNYMSFKWAVDSETNRGEYLALCKNNAEKAEMLALFALNGISNKTEIIKEIFTLDTENKTLETLIAREINKLEESYFTPVLNTETGGKLFYYTWIDTPGDSLLNVNEMRVKNLENTLKQFADSKTGNSGFYFTSAAYCALMYK